MGRKKGLIIGIIIAAVLCFSAAAAVLIGIYMNPKVQVVTAFLNTMETAKESAINKEYGTYDMLEKMSRGTYDVEASFMSDQEDGREISLGVRRNPGERKFYAFAESDKDISDKIDAGKICLYADESTSIITYKSAKKDLGIQVDYADDLKGNLNSSLFKLVGIDEEDLDKYADMYVDIMQDLTDTGKKTSSTSEFYEMTLNYAMGLESEKLDKKEYTINGKKQKCTEYKIKFDAEDTLEYIKGVYDLSEKDGGQVDAIVKKITGRSIDEIYTELKNNAKDVENLDVYFAVNNKRQLVSIYCKNVSDKDMSFDITFKGGDYLCDEVEISYKDNTGADFFIKKNDVSEGKVLRTEISCDYNPGNGKATDSLQFSYTIKDSKLILNIQNAKTDKEIEIPIKDYKKGKYLYFASSDEKYTLYVGSSVKAIEKPDSKNVLNITDMTIVDAYNFFSEFK